MLEHFLPPEKFDPFIEIYQNLQEKPYKEHEPNMFEQLDRNESIDLLQEKIDPLTNIIICSSENETLRRNPEGTLSYLTNRPLDISNSKNFGQMIAVVDYLPRIKISVPKSIKLEITEPETSIYHNKIYKELTKVQKKNFEDNIPGHVVYNEFRLTFHFDMQRMRRKLTTLNLKKGTALFDITFHPIYHVGSHDFPLLENIYWLKNEEAYRQFNEIF